MLVNSNQSCSCLIVWNIACIPINSAQVLPPSLGRCIKDAQVDVSITRAAEVNLSFGMAPSALLPLQLLLLASLAMASHYYGGTTSFSYKGRNPDGSFNLAIRNRNTYDGCGYSLYWYCSSGNCGSPTSSSNWNVIDRSTNAPIYEGQWCETETVQTRRLYTNKPFEMRASSCCWISTRNGVGNWRLNTLVDLGVRSDTGEPNRSPDIAILPFLRVPQNCPRTYKLASFDPDGDRVRCRKTIKSFGVIPLDFTVFVDPYDAPSCVDGDYFPFFVSPTPQYGFEFTAFVNRTLEIEVRSVAQYAKINDLILTGPLGISKERVSTDTFTIKWTPTEFDKYGYYPICFVSEALNNYQAFHSEMRCVTVYVARHEATVTCNETTMTIEIEKTSVIRSHEGSLHLNSFTDSSCNLTKNSNSTHLVGVMPLSSCGTLIEEDNDDIIFSNVITSADVGQTISRGQHVDVAFSCAYPKRANLSLGFSHKNPSAFSERGFGSFSFQFEFFETESFARRVEASSYPVTVYLRQMLYMQIDSSSSIPDTQLFVESCRATPYDNPNARLSYSIIEDGCVRDQTVQIYNSSKGQFRFGMEAFEFIGTHDEVYISCSVILCESGVPGTRCSQGCLGSPPHRQRREAAAQTGRHSISQGPLHLAAEAPGSRSSGPGWNLGLNSVFIVGCLLVCGVVVYRSRGTNVKYQPLPTSDH
ncbi:unnamed protein product [Menidia menidia]|uniref:(Atlantic silverside) hypothetical protein n=1 Tax=Menidia menidia TaxID=238744 RepID=A0A8S4AGW8_9TELE|nr:unnamed protein product [Menidia menidia]